MAGANSPAVLRGTRNSARGVERGPSSRHVTLLTAALAAGLIGQGAFHILHLALMAVCLMAALVAAWWYAPPRRSDFGWVAAASIALAGWALLRGALADSWANGLTVAVTCLAIAAVLWILARTRLEDRLAALDGLLIVGVLVAATGWLGVALHLEPLAIPDPSVWRAATTLTYPNAAAGLLAPLAIVALARRVDRPGSRWLSVAVFALLAGLALTMSRGGFVAALVGGLLAAALGGWWRYLRGALLPGLAAAAALAGLAPSLGVATTPQPLPAALGLIAGGVLAWSQPALAERWGARLALPRAARAVAPAVAVTAVAGVAVVGLALTRGFALMALSSSDRVNETVAAWGVFTSAPLAGAGPGEASLVWQGDGGLLMARYAHNEYLQVAADLGLIGLALMTALAVSLLFTALGGRNWAPSEAVWAGVVGAVVAFGVHSSLDFLWHISALPVVAAALIGLVSRPLAAEPASPHDFAPGVGGRGSDPT